jgi:hypothetical protein
MRFNRYLLFLLLSIILISLSCTTIKNKYENFWPDKTKRYWIGPEFWANRLQDWQINQGRLECIDAALPIRTVHLLTHTLKKRAASFEMDVTVGIISNKLDENAYGGFLIGAGDLSLDYRARAIIHHSIGENAGLAAGINAKGEIVFIDNENGAELLKQSASQGKPQKLLKDNKVRLKLSATPIGDNYSIILSAYNNKSGEMLVQGVIENIPASRLTGNVALIVNGCSKEDNTSFWFKNWVAHGKKFSVSGHQKFGPILSSMYTVSKGVLKLTAQMVPLADSDSQQVTLQIKEKGTTNWQTIAKEKIIIPGWSVPFCIKNWDDSKDYDYQLIYPYNQKSGIKKDIFQGRIRHNPKEKEEIVVAGFTGNSNTHGSFGEQYSFSQNRLWFPHNDIMTHVKKHKPDLLFYSGDQVYEVRPTAPDMSGKFSSYLDYLYKWYLFCWAHCDLTKNIPSILLMDDHDVYHGNIWGEGGKKAPRFPKNNKYPEYYKEQTSAWAHDQGGYIMPAEFVKMAERTQTSHLPDPFDPTPVKQGIGVYYTDLNYGGISFAILEDRKFKSAPSIHIPAGKVVNGFFQDKNFDVRKADVKSAKLLGERQLRFLRHWAADWKDSWMKVALSQTIFANVSTYPDSFSTDEGTPQLKPEPAGVIPENYSVAKDMDSNAWPQTGRNKALAELRKGFAFMYAGDQHLGSLVHHGIDDWDDAGWSFCVPSIANLWPRRWFPHQKGYNHQKGLPDYTGSYLDGFGNHMTVWAVSNPCISNVEPADLYDRAPGYGIIKLNKIKQTITVECWPRYADPEAENAKQYPGWPFTIQMEDNYGKKAAAYLPTLKFEGIQNPVVQVIQSSNKEIVYTIRAKESNYKPKVFKKTSYDLKIGEPGTEKMKKIHNVLSVTKSNRQSIVVNFN